MDAISGILDKIQPGTSSSILYQFVIFVVLFAVLKHLIFNKLLFVLQIRESKTVKLDEQAGHKFKEAEDLSKKFDTEVKKTNEEVHKRMTERKNIETKKIVELQSEKEQEVLKNYEIQKSELVNELEAQRPKLLNKSDELSASLLEKILN